MTRPGSPRALSLDSQTAYYLLRLTTKVLIRAASPTRASRGVAEIGEYLK